jgi:hypothetical protein
MSSLTETGRRNLEALARLEPAGPAAIEKRAGASRLLSRLYRDVGLAAIAEELSLPPRSMDSEMAAAIERGAALLKARRDDIAA